MKANDLTNWQRRLAGEVIPIIADEPDYGFYRVRNREKTAWRTVAYWYTPEGDLRCHADGRDIDDLRARELWPFASKSPITHETYLAVREGGAWPDQHEAVTRDRINSQGAPDDASFEALNDRIADLAREAESLVAAGAAKTKDEADRAADLANRLGELWNKADDARKAEKKAHDDAAKAVQAKWLPILSAAEVYKRIKAAVVTPFLVAEDSKRKAAEAELAKASEAAAKSGAAAPLPSPALHPVKAGSGGRRSVALRTVKKVEIVDRAATLAFFADNQELAALLQSLSEKAVRAGVTVPGTKVTDTQVAA